MQALEFTDVRKGFDGKTVLNGFSAKVSGTGLTFIVGKTGSGKSVLCRLAAGLLRSDGGTIHLLGQDVGALPERGLQRLRAQAPYLVQGPALLDWLSLEENVSLTSAGSLSDGRAAHALERVGLKDFGQRRPTEVGPGVKKRAAIARALVLAPAFMLLDEPTTGLDRDARAQVNACIEGLRESGQGAVIVSHDYAALAAMADHVVEVSNGKKGYEGDREGFLKYRRTATP